MKSEKLIAKNIKSFLLAVMVFLVSITQADQLIAQQQTPLKTSLPPIGTSAILGKIDDVSIEVTVQSPSTEETPLQIVCVFEYVEGDIFKSPPALPAALNGIVHVDHQLNGLITELRKSGMFKGHALETILITPPKGSIPAEKLLLIGLGNRDKFNPDIMTDVGKIGMREALRLGVSRYAHASDLKDGGLDSPTALIAGNVLKGAFEAYKTELYLKDKNYTSFTPLTKITLLAGQAFFLPSSKAVEETIKAINK